MAGGFQLHVEVFGEEVISRRLLRFANDLRDMRSSWGRIARILRRATARNFATQGSSSGSAWPPLAESTLKAKAAKGQPSRILVATGLLEGSLLGTGQGHVERRLPQMFEWGSDVPYGQFHMTGTSRMPARPPVRLTMAVKREITRELQRGLVEAAR